MAKKSFLIIGMGTFGHHLCRELAKQRCEVMAVDAVAEAVEDVLSLVVSAKVGDCTKEEVLRSFGIPDFDTCFVCVGSNFLAGLQIISSLKELGAKHVIGKVDELVQQKFLLRNGADEVILPDKDEAVRLAASVCTDNIFDYIPLTRDYAITEVEPLKEWIGKSIAELQIRPVYNLSVLATKKGDEMFPMPGPNYVFQKGTHVIVMGHVDAIRKITR